MTHHRRARLALCGATSLLMLVGQAHATSFSKAVYTGAKEDLEALYKTQKKACDSQSGNAKDICLEIAKGREKVALAQLEYNYTGADKDEVKLYESVYKANYEVAKETCDDLSGNDKDVCLKTAVGTRDKAKADLKLAKAVTAANEDALEAHAKADYKVVREKCDALNGNTKDICVASAKARYNVRW